MYILTKIFEALVFRSQWSPKPQGARVTAWMSSIWYVHRTWYKALYQYDAVAAPATASHREDDVYMKACQRRTICWRKLFWKQFVYINLQAFCIDVSRIFCTNMLIIG